MKKLAHTFAALFLLLFPLGIQSSRDATIRLSESMAIALAPSADVPTPAESTDHLVDYDPSRLTLKVMPDNSLHAFDVDGNRRWTFQTETRRMLGEREVEVSRLSDEEGSMLKTVIADSPRMTTEHILLGSSVTTVYALDPANGFQLAKFDLNGTTHSSINSPIDPLVFKVTLHSVQGLNITSGAVDFEVQFREYDVLDIYPSLVDALNSPKSDDTLLPKQRHTFEGSRFTPLCTRPILYTGPYQLPDDFLDNINQTLESAGRVQELLPGSQLPTFIRTLPGNSTPVPLLVNDQAAGQAPRSFIVWWIGGLVFVCLGLGTVIWSLFRKREVKAAEQEQEQVPVKKNKKNNKKLKKTRPVEETAGKVEQDRGVAVKETAHGKVNETAEGKVNETAEGKVNETAQGKVNETAQGKVNETAQRKANETAQRKEKISLVVPDRVIGYGSHGTMILEGSFEGRHVAVKRVLAAFYDQAEKEISALIELDHHPNILRYYTRERNNQFVHIALERCSFNLETFILVNSTRRDDRSDVNEFEKAELQSVLEENIVLWSGDGYPSSTLMKLLKDIVQGLVHLHELGYVHRDLKPQNVLIRRNRKGLQAKLSDMGISKRLTDGSSSFGATKTSSTGIGSSGWRAPEQIQNGRQTRSVDLFSLGCLLYFCITAGHHPFGEVFERDLNILRGRPDLFPIEHFPEATDLFSRMLEQDPQKRPSAQELKVHPFFWSPEKRLSFLIAASERVEREDRDPNAVVLPALEAGVFTVAQGQWNVKLDADLLYDLNRYRQYNNTARDLLRVIRNKVNHYRELPPHVQQMVGSVPQGFEMYFRVRFPKLLMEVYNVLKQQCFGEDMFKRYFAEESEF